MRTTVEGNRGHGGDALALVAEEEGHGLVGGIYLIGRDFRMSLIRNRGLHMEFDSNRTPLSINYTHVTESKINCFYCTNCVWHRS
jgi:hypothetical protein